MFARLGLLLLGSWLAVPMLAQTLASSVVPSAQTAAARSAADQLVDKLVENAAVLHATLPSITAHETMESHSSKGLFRNSTGEATMRMLRASPGGELKETDEMTIIDGNPARHSWKKGPSYYADAFFGTQELFFNSKNRTCFSFDLIPQPTKESALELRIAPSPEYASIPICQSSLRALRASRGSIRQPIN